MKQEEIGKLIKKIRKENNLSQQKFASQYGVTYQAVSKWETGKNIPDISILKKICDDYKIDLNDLLDNKATTKKKDKKIFFIVLIAILVIVITSSIIIIINNKNKNDFEFKTLSSTCDSFNLYGSIAYNKKKSSIYISNVTYCGGNDTKVYKEITCTLYENDENAKIEISKCNYTDNKDKTLEEFMQDINFKIDNYEPICRDFKEDTLHLEIDAIDENNETTTYKVPLKLADNCLN